MVTNGCSFYLGCKSELNTAHCINSKQLQTDIQHTACPDQVTEQRIKNKTLWQEVKILRFVANTSPDLRRSEFS